MKILHEPLLHFLVIGAALFGVFQLVDTGDALQLGVGAMTDARMKDFHQKALAAGLYKPGDFALESVYTTQFVNKGAGLDLRRKLAAK